MNFKLWVLTPLVIIALLILASFAGSSAETMTPQTSFLWFIPALLILAVGLGIYLLPSYLAKVNKSEDVTQIFILNLLLGWSVIAWVIALVWAYKKNKQQTMVVINQEPAHQSDYKKCPYCAENIQKDAVKCRYCSETLH